jgi:hypothetical protein
MSHLLESQLAGEPVTTESELKERLTDKQDAALHLLVASAHVKQAALVSAMRNSQNINAPLPRALVDYLEQGSNHNKLISHYFLLSPAYLALTLDLAIDLDALRPTTLLVLVFTIAQSLPDFTGLCLTV